MNSIITKSDVKKFLALLKTGLEENQVREIQIYTSKDHVNPDRHYVSLEMRFYISNDAASKIMAEDLMDNDIQDIFDQIKP